MPYQLNASQLFLTYPQCPLSKEFAREDLTARFEALGLEVKEYVVAEELHKNGDPHLHCYFKLSAPFRTRDQHALDLRGFHGSYEGCRSAKNVIKYCTKDDNFTANIDVAALLSKKSSRQRIAEAIVNEGKALKEVIQDHPALIYDYDKLTRCIDTWKSECTPSKPPLPQWLPNPWGKLLPVFPDRKRQHYWIWSRRPNLGKTTMFAKPLVSEYNAVIQSGTFQRWNVTRFTQCIILDDYNTAALKWNELNQMCDNTYCFSVIYKGIITPEKYIMIILSNVSLDTLYPHMNVFLYERFKEIELF